MCLSVSRLFWVSSLAYSNLLGIKGYVVVVVILRDREEGGAKGARKTGGKPKCMNGAAIQALMMGAHRNPTVTRLCPFGVMATTSLAP
jgi:hypothetical protein